MSRKGKVPIPVPKNVKVTVQPSGVHLEGPKGKMDLAIPQGINVAFKDDQLIITRQRDAKQDRANHGTTRALLAKIIQGVTEIHKRELELQGIGFRAQLKGANSIILNLGLSHPVEFLVPSAVKASVPSQTMIILESVDEIILGQTAASIRGIKPAEPYKGKGFRYVGEIVRRKQGKSVTK